MKTTMNDSKKNHVKEIYDQMKALSLDLEKGGHGYDHLCLVTIPEAQRFQIGLDSLSLVGSGRKIALGF